MHDRLIASLDQRENVKQIGGIEQHPNLPWLFVIPSPYDATRIIAQVLEHATKVNVEVGCGNEPTRTQLLDPGIWFAFDPSDLNKSYFSRAEWDWKPEEIATVPDSYLLILVPIEFHDALIEITKVRTLLLRNPDHAHFSGSSAFDEIPNYDYLQQGQRVVIVRDDSISGPYERLLVARGYPDTHFYPWNGSEPLTADKPANREFPAEVFDCTKV